MDELYREQLLERYKNPLNKGKVIKATHIKEDSNPLCGDTVEISLRIDKQGKVADAKFNGKGCVISQASSDMLMEHIKGKTLQEIQSMTREDILDLIGINLNHTRIKCAMLPLAAIKKAIIEKESKQ